MLMPRYRILAGKLLFFFGMGVTWSAEVHVDSGRVLDTLVHGHPRLILKEDALQDLKKKAESDETLRRFVRETVEQADKRLDDPKLLYKKRGPRLLQVSRACLERVYDLGIAWRWTGQEKYAEKIKETLLTVCDFPDWNPSHFLDAAEMSHAVGVGYDWTYDYLDAETRSRVRTALVEKGLKPGIERYKRKYHHFTDAAIEIEKPDVARLHLKGRELIARVLSPSGANFTVESAEQPPPQKSNKGVSRLVVRLPKAKGDTRIAVLLSPEWQDGVSLRKMPVKPLEEW
ncbi:hypothetical protein ACFL6U_13430 [Planctomycetota bacterium]